jgi:hypothetical protein
MWAADDDEEEDDQPLTTDVRPGQSRRRGVVSGWRAMHFSTGSMRAASVRVLGLGRQGAVVNGVFSMVFVPWLSPLSDHKLAHE